MEKKDKVFNRLAYERTKDHITALSNSLEVNYPKVMASGLSVEQIRNIRTEDDFRKFINEEKRKYLANCGFVPNDERLRIAQSYERVFDGYCRAVLSVSGVYASKCIVIEEGKDGTPTVNIDKSLELSKDSYYDTIDGAELLRLRDALGAFVGAFKTFSDAVREKHPTVDLIGGDSLFVNGCKTNLYGIAQTAISQDGEKLDDWAEMLFLGLVRK